MNNWGRVVSSFLGLLVLVVIIAAAWWAGGQIRQRFLTPKPTAPVVPLTESLETTPDTLLGTNRESVATYSAIPQTGPQALGLIFLLPLGAIGFGLRSLTYKLSS